jgi:hypothetical protein
VVEILPHEPQKGIKTLHQPKNVVGKQTPLPLGVVENLSLGSLLLQKSKKGGGNSSTISGNVVENQPSHRS